MEKRVILKTAEAELSDVALGISFRCKKMTPSGDNKGWEPL
jgi:hypothetical protein